MILQAGKETIYKQDFQTVLEQTKDAWLKDLRQKAFAFFTENGFPTPKNEEWKYTNVAEISNFRFQISDLRNASETSEFLKQFDYERNGFTALNLAFADIVLVTIPKETSIAEPIEFNFKADENTAQGW